MTTYILIPRDGTDDHDAWPTDTHAEIAAAAAALRAAGLGSCDVWTGEAPDAVRTGQMFLSGAPPAAASVSSDAVGGGAP